MFAKNMTKRMTDGCIYLVKTSMRILTVKLCHWTEAKCPPPSRLYTTKHLLGPKAPSAAEIASLPALPRFETPTIDCKPNPVAAILAKASYIAEATELVERMNDSANILTNLVLEKADPIVRPQMTAAAHNFLTRQYAYFFVHVQETGHDKATLLAAVGSAYDTWVTFFQQQQDRQNENEHRPTRP